MPDAVLYSLPGTVVVGLFRERVHMTVVPRRREKAKEGSGVV
jgi:hypothetical protein